jgi:hypothetical protein
MNTTLSPVHARREFEDADPTAGAARWLAICFLFTALAALSAVIALS